MTKTKKKILLIDDDPSVSASLLMLLKDEFDTHAAETVREGVELFEIVHPDVVILDLHLPDSHGLEALRSIRRMDRSAPVVILTGYATLEVVEESMRLGASDCLHKPFNAKALRSRLRELSEEESDRDPEDLVVEEARRESAYGNDVPSPEELASSAFLHDISNPLTSLLAISSMLKESLEDPEKRVKFSDMIGENVAYLSSLVDQWRAFSEPEMLEVDCAPLGVIVENATELVRLRAEAKNVVVTVDAQDLEVQPALNRHATVRILVNLLQNAIEAVDRGAGRVDLRAKSRGGTVEFVVEDNGCGIEPGATQKIFRPRYTTKKKGTGLGLYIARRMIESVNGSISICSRLGRGTTFTVHLPAC